MGKQKATIMLFILVPGTWLQNHPTALGFGYKMVLEPTKTDHHEQSYDQIKLTIKIITNKNPCKLISFFAPMEKTKQIVVTPLGTSVSRNGTELHGFITLLTRICETGPQANE